MNLPAAGYTVRSVHVDGGEDMLSAHVMHGLAQENPNKYWQRITFCVVARGIGTYEMTPGHCHDLIPGSYYMHPPDRWHRIKRQQHLQWIEVSVGFGPLFTQHLIGLGLIDAEQPFGSIGDLSAWLAGFAHFQRMLNDPKIDDRRCLISAFELMTNACHPQQRSHDDEAIARSRVDLSNDMQERIDLDQYAQSLGMSYAHFRRRFAGIVGCAPAAWRRRHRLDHAALLMRQHGFSVAEASQAIGYATPFAFSRIFSATFGVSPSAYAAGASPGQAPQNSNLE